MNPTEQTLLKHAKGGAGILILAIITGLFVAFFSILLIYSITAGDSEMIGFFVFVVLGFGFSFGLCLYNILNPTRNHVFRKYGSASEIAKMIDEALNDPNKIYEDKSMVITRKYILNRKKYTSFHKLDDILAAYPFTQSYNFVPVAAGLQIIDKWGEQLQFTFGVTTTKAKEIMDAIMPYCPNTSFGFSAQTNQYVKQNKIALPPQQK